MRKLATAVAITRPVPRSERIISAPTKKVKKKLWNGSDPTTYDTLVARVLTSRYERGDTIKDICAREHLSKTTASRICSAHVAEMLGPYLHAHRNPPKKAQ